MFDVAKALISESIRRHRLNSDYNVFGMRNNSVVDGEAMYQHLAEWPRWKNVIDLKNWIKSKIMKLQKRFSFVLSTLEFVLTLLYSLSMVFEFMSHLFIFYCLKLIISFSMAICVFWSCSVKKRNKIICKLVSLWKIILIVVLKERPLICEDPLVVPIWNISPLWRFVTRISGLQFKEFQSYELQIILQQKKTEC